MIKKKEPDDVRKKAEKELKKLERKIRKMYKDSYSDISKEWDEFMDKADAKLQKAQSKYDSAVRSGDTVMINQTKKTLDELKQKSLLRNKEYKEMLDETTTKMAEANKTATTMMNSLIPAMYAIGYSNPSETYSVPKDVEKAMKSSFEIRSEHVIRRRVTEGDIELPNKEKRLSIPKDKRWNTKKINSQVLQGILRGESAKEIAKRLKPIMNNNEEAAMRNARTLMTGAENQGRLEDRKSVV